MKLEIIDRETLFSGTIETEYFKVENDNVDRLWSLFQLYNSKRASENYSRLSFDSLILDNRFSYGAAVTTLNGSPIAFCGLRNYHNWVVITRLVILKYYLVPFVSGYMFPYLLEMIKKDKLEGIVATFNSYNSGICRTLAVKDRKSMFEEIDSIKHIVDHEVYAKATEIGHLFEKLDYTVNYNFVEQSVAYIPLNNSIPPFERFDK